MNARQNPSLANDDERLAKIAAARDEESGAAFFALYDKYSKLVLVFVQSRVPAKDADDLQQEIWSRAWKHASKFTGGNYRAWLLTIAGHQVVDFYRKRSRSRETTTEFLDSETTDPMATPLEALIDEEVRGVFEKCLQQLDQRSLMVVQKRIAGESYRQICASNDLTENAAHKLLFNAKSQIRECIENKTK